MEDFAEEVKQTMCERIQHVGGIVTLLSLLSSVSLADLLENQVIEDSD